MSGRAEQTDGQATASRAASAGELIDLSGGEWAGAAGELGDRVGTVDHDAADAELAQRSPL